MNLIKYKKLAIFSVILLCISLLSCNKSNPNKHGILSKSYPRVKVVLSNQTHSKKLNLEIANTPSAHSQGLMFRESLNKNQGMLFIFNSEGVKSFWMKNTLIDLDILFFNKNKKLVEHTTLKKEKLNQEPDRYTSKFPASYVVEVPAGWLKDNFKGDLKNITIDWPEGSL